MSVQTHADEKLDNARKALREAYDSLKEIVIDECSGSDEYTPEFQHRVESAFSLTKDALQALKPVRR